MQLKRRDFLLATGLTLVFGSSANARILKDDPFIFPARSIARRLSHSPAPWPVKLGTNLGYRFYAHHLSRFYNCDWIIGNAGQSGPKTKFDPAAAIAK